MTTPSLDASDFMSIGDRLGGSRIDAAIEKTRYAGIPLQGEQTGGFSPKYMHLAHIPLFPLYHSSQTIALQKNEEQKQRHLAQMTPLQNVTGAQKAVLAANSMLTGGVNPLSVKKWENRLVGVGAVTKQRLQEQSSMLVFTRWIVPTEGIGQKGEEIWFIDVLEWRAKMGAKVYLKTGKDVAFKTLEKNVKKRRAGKLWTSTFFNTKVCEAITWVGENGQEVEMEIVASIERTCAPLEAHASLKVFDKEWSVPSGVLA